MIALAVHLLQSTACAACIALVALAFRRNPARTRHALWMAASLKFLVPFSLLIALGSHLAPRPAPLHPLPEFTLVMPQQGGSALPPIGTPVLPQVSSPPRMEYAFVVLYLGVFAGIAMRWRRRWKAIAAAVDRAVPVSHALAVTISRVAVMCRVHPVRALVSSIVPEPCVFGVFRPVLILPAGIETRLAGAQLEAVIAHELCHVRRRDNLWAALHMAVECLLWFHPLVWWIRTRLVEERESACDEAVLEFGADREAYAGGIVEVSRLAVEAPLAFAFGPCASGIAGPNLKTRIVAIMTSPAARPLGISRAALLAALTGLAIGAPLAFGLLHPTTMRAQVPQAPTPVAFDAASVKPSQQPWLQIAPQRSGGRINWTTDLHYLIQYAYHIEPWRLSGLIPGSESIYEIQAETAAGASEDQVRSMFQSLLTERFHMQAHRVSKEVEGWALTVGKGGPKAKPAKEGEQPPLPEWFAKGGANPEDLEGKVVATMPAAGVGTITGRRASMTQLAEGLQRVLRGMVIDDTGLAGNYYFATEFAQENHPPEVDLPSIFAALQEDLGLKLENRKSQVEILVVDRIDRIPTEN